MEKRQIFILIFYFVFVNSFSQGKTFFPNNVQKQKIRFEFLHNLILIPLEINDAKLNFILDTGASKTVIFSLSDSDSLTLKNTKPIEIRGLGLGEPIQAILSENNTFRINEIVGVNQTVYLVFDEQLDLSSKIGKTIHGIIGYEFFKDFIVTIDYQKKILIVEQENLKIKNRLKKYTVLPLIFHQNKPYIDCILEFNEMLEIKDKMLLDTGNSDAIWVFENKQKNITTPIPNFKDHLGEGLSGSIDGKRAKIKSITFGNFHLKEPVTAFLDSSSTFFAQSFENRNGSIGNELMKKFKIVFDYQHNLVYMKKNAEFPKEFSYNRTGIELSYFGKTLIKSEKVSQGMPYTSGDNEQSKTISFVVDYKYEFKSIYGISRIRPDSPAAIAGMKENDLLYKINGKFAYEYEIEEIIGLFQKRDDDKLKIQVERNGSLYYFELQLVDLL